MPTGRRILRPREAWQRLGIGHSKFYELVGSGQLRLVRIGPRAVGVLEHELDQFIDQLPAREVALASD